MAAAIAAQDAIDDLDVGVRMAIHAGSAEVRDGDFYEPTVNRVARLRSLAQGGEIVISGAALSSAKHSYRVAASSSTSVRSPCAACTAPSS
ncbi:MAG: hypothetical protein ACRDV7_12225 [Acidimicrobiia bacterium]